MKGITKMYFIFAGLLFASLLISCEDEEIERQVQNTDLAASISKDGDIVPAEYIIQLKENIIPPAINYIKSEFSSRKERSQFMKEKETVIIEQLKSFLIQNNINPNKVKAYYTAGISGFAIELTEKEFQAFSTNKAIKAVEHNRIGDIPYFAPKDRNLGHARMQTTPCGVQKAGGPVLATSNRLIWVVDSGIDVDHPDLNVETSLGKSFVPNNTSFDDIYGHGTHISGIAAAIDNGFGVVGVAAGAPVVPIKIFEPGTSFSTTIFFGALNYIIQNGTAGDVIAIASGTGPGIPSIGTPIGSGFLRTLSNMNIRVAMAAGNSADDAALYYPPRVNEANVFTIVAMDCDENWWRFSNYGHQTCDYAATGVNVYSTDINGTYSTHSGTSMAAPHVAGIMQLRNDLPRTNGFVSRVPSTPFNRVIPYPIAVY